MTLNSKKVRSFVRSFERLKHPERSVQKIRAYDQMIVHDSMKSKLQARVQHTAFGNPFNGDLGKVDSHVTSVQHTIDRLTARMQDAEENYHKGIETIGQKLDKLHQQQLKEHQLHLKQNKMLAIKGHIISLERRLQSLRKVHRPRLLEPMEYKLQDLKNKYLEIIHNDRELADVTDDLLAQPTLEPKELALPIEEQKQDLKIHELRRKEIQRALQEQPTDLALPEIRHDSGSLELPDPIPTAITMGEPIPADIPEPPKPGFFHSLFHKKDSGNHPTGETGLLPPIPEAPAKE